MHNIWLAEPISLLSLPDPSLLRNRTPRPRGYKTFFMHNSTEHEIFPAHKCQNANICWHFNIYEREKNSILDLPEPEKKPNFLTFLYLCALKISYSTELSMKNVLLPRGLIRPADLPHYNRSSLAT